jgi:hypothetical protein
LSVRSGDQIFKKGENVMIEVGKPTPDFELASHLGDTKYGVFLERFRLFFSAHKEPCFGTAETVR